jgi:hypothetical protein
VSGPVGHWFPLLTVEKRWPARGRSPAIKFTRIAWTEVGLGARHHKSCINAESHRIRKKYTNTHRKLKYAFDAEIRIQ